MNQEKLLQILEERFVKHPHRHEGLTWAAVAEKLEKQKDKLRTLGEMEETGGEPDVVGRNPDTGEFLFMDCSPETPEGRRNACYDGPAEESRKKKGVFPEGNAVDRAQAMGMELLTEDDYHLLQEKGPVDLKTSSWLKTPEKVRKLGGAIFGDCRYGRVFVYHNGAPSFYGVRGFRGKLWV